VLGCSTVRVIFADLRMVPGAKISIESFFMEISFFSVHSAASFTQKCCSREKREEGVKLFCFMSKATSIPEANHSQYYSPVKALLKFDR